MQLSKLQQQTQKKATQLNSPISVEGQSHHWKERKSQGSGAERNIQESSIIAPHKSQVKNKRANVGET